jgi:hypothetical protein
MRSLWSPPRVLAVILATVCVPTLAAQDFRTEFAAGELRTKQQMLDGIMTQRVSIASAELADVLRIALQDSEPSVRERALLAIAARAGAPRFLNNSQTQARWRTDHEALQSLRSLVISSLRDSEENIRHDGVLALGNMDFDLEAATPTPRLSEETLRALQTTYIGESSGKVRAEIVKGIALSANDSPAVRQFIVTAFDDLYAGVRQYAAVAAARRNDPSFVEKLMQRMRGDADSSVRFASASAIASYGSLVVNRIPELRTILEAERDQKVQGELQRTISRLEGRR